MVFSVYRVRSFRTSKKGIINEGDAIKKKCSVSSESDDSAICSAERGSGSQPSPTWSIESQYSRSVHLLYKALNGNSLIFAHPSTLNKVKAHWLQGCQLRCSTYGISPSQTPKMGYAQPMGFLLFKVDRWANIKEFPFRAFCAHSTDYLNMWKI